MVWLSGFKTLEKVTYIIKPDKIKIRPFIVSNVYMLNFKELAKNYPLNSSCPYKIIIHSMNLDKYFRLSNHSDFAAFYGKLFRFSTLNFDFFIDFRFVSNLILICF